MGGQSNNQDLPALSLANGATPFSGAAPAGTYVTPDLQNLSHRGIKLYINISAVSGTGPTLTVTIQGKDPVSGQYFTVLVSVALATTGETVLTVYPGLAATANVGANDVLPATWRVQALVAGTTPTVTATIAASLLY
jgi:hypothetical protein